MNLYNIKHSRLARQGTLERTYVGNPQNTLDSSEWDTSPYEEDDTPIMENEEVYVGGEDVNDEDEAGENPIQEAVRMQREFRASTRAKRPADYEVLRSMGGTRGQPIFKKTNISVQQTRDNGDVRSIGATQQTELYLTKSDLSDLLTNTGAQPYILMYRGRRGRSVMQELTQADFQQAMFLDTPVLYGTMTSGLLMKSMEGSPDGVGKYLGLKLTASIRS